ncbi:dystroglycan [Eurytemora carolleeae]|uniref:dystroglycan n=1 Tax=Eurytemora carolleeae TaxID=1294199 RepID=UPI000C781725|nr:dystroglycan [Eurytemora carolleeae]|eukprot:XP_023319632.1 dystroglycan-like [Eurytemora affinis]
MEENLSINMVGKNLGPVFSLAISCLFTSTVLGNQWDELARYESERSARDIEGSAYDYDDDEDQDYGSNSEILPSRVVPEPSSPTFSLPSSRSSVGRGGISNTAVFAPSSNTNPERIPSRPDQLSSYYPGLRSEGSGVEFPINTLAGDIDEADLISPTRSEYPGPSSSIIPTGPAFPPKNHQPFITNRLNKLSLIAGKSSRIIIPANTFQDLEDGDTRDLSLRIVEFNSQEELDTLDWIQYHPTRQELVALPLESEIGTWKFRVIATDKGGESVVDVLEIIVRQHSSSRVFHHVFKLYLTLVSSWKYPHPIDWKIEVLERIHEYFGDRDPSKLTVLGIQQSQDNIEFFWTNETLPLQTCPRDEIRGIFNQINSGGSVAPGFKTAFKEDFLVSKVDLVYNGLCKESGRDRTDDSARVPPTGFDNSMPQIRNPVDKLNVMAGELLQFQVPEDMCFDSENGMTRYLELSLLTKQRLEVTTGNWLQFDKKNQEFYGVPLEGDVGREAYQLVCADTQGLMAIDGIEVHVVGRPFDEQFNLEFIFVFNDTLDDGTRLLNNRVRLIKTIAKIFNDPDTRHVVLKNVDPISFEVTWYNKSIEDQNCPKKWLQKTKTFLMDKDGNPRQHVMLNFAPEFHLSDVKMVELGACVKIAKPDPTDDADLAFFPPDQEYILTFLVPALIIVAMLLLAVLIACLLHR